MALLLDIAGRITTVWQSGKSPVDINFADGTHLPKTVMFRKHGDCQDISLIEGQWGSYVTIRLPIDGLASAPPQHWTNTPPLIAAVLVQEVTHSIQEHDEPSAVRAAKAEFAAWLKSLNGAAPSSRPPLEQLANYYGTAFELEAHAAQIAAERYYTGTPFALTHTWQRIRGRLAPILSTTDGKTFARSLCQSHTAHYNSWLAQVFSN